MKYKRGLVKDIEEQRLFEKEQKELKKKHHISEQEDRIVVEKDNMTKFFYPNRRKLGSDCSEYLYWCACNHRSGCSCLSGAASGIVGCVEDDFRGITKFYVIVQSFKTLL